MSSGGPFAGKEYPQKCAPAGERSSPGEIQQKSLIRRDGFFVDDHGRGDVLEGGSGAVEQGDFLRRDAAGLSSGAELRELGVDAGPLDRPTGERMVQLADLGALVEAVGHDLR